MDNEVELKNDSFLVSKTNTMGIITYFNKEFQTISGYNDKELMMENHNILRHKDMPKLIFKHMWQELLEEKEVNAYIKNRCKNGDYYWVWANVTPSYNEHRKVVGYFSVRKKADEIKIRHIEDVYRQIRILEDTKGLESAKELFMSDILKGESYEKFILSI